AVQEGGEGLMRLTGELHTTDTAELEQVKKLVIVTVNGTATELTWTQAEDRKTNSFTLENIARGEQNGKVRVEWDGAAIGSHSKGARDLGLPSRSAFVVTGVRVVRQPETYIEVNFSAPLNRQQNLAGLVTFNQQNPQLRVDGSSLRVYPNDLPQEKTTEPVELVISDLILNANRDRKSVV